MKFQRPTVNTNKQRLKTRAQIAWLPLGLFTEQRWTVCLDQKLYRFHNQSCDTKKCRDHENTACSLSEIACTVLADRPSAYRDTRITTLVPDGQIIGKHNASSPLYKFNFYIARDYAEKENVAAIKIYSNISALRGSEQSSCSSRVMEQQQDGRGSWSRDETRRGVADGSHAWFPEVESFFRMAHAAGLMVRTAWHSTSLSLPARSKPTRCIMKLFTVVFGLLVYIHNECCAFISIWMTFPPHCVF